jgi:predicted hydrocarbon binding protein
MPQHSIDLSTDHMVAVGRSTLTALHAALLRDAGPVAVEALREAGFAGGEALFASFAAWLRGRAGAAPEELSVEEFEARATDYFRETGWGSVKIGSLGGAVATLDSEDWGEADPGAALERPGCHLSTGMFADFFGRVSEHPLAVLEVECRSAGAPRCRFLLGSSEVMAYIYEEMARGVRYEDAAGAVGEATSAP